MRIFDIADIPFEQVSDEEKQQYAGKMKQTGAYRGYKPRSYWVSISPKSRERLALIMCGRYRLACR